MTTTLDQYLAENLRLVQTGCKSRAPGIRRCGDCKRPWIDDHTGLAWCPDCRVTHTRRCRTCGTPFTNTRAGDVLCVSCRDQDPLFDLDPATGGESS